MIKLELLGGLRVTRGGTALPGFDRKRRRAALLVYLAVEGRAARETICALLWPDSDPKRARHSLSQTLVGLRQDLGREWLDEAGEQLAPASIDLDLDELNAAFERGDPEAVLRRYNGAFLEGVHLASSLEFERWIEERRSSVDRMVRQAYRDVCSKVSGDEAGIGRIREWVAFDPMEDEANHALIEALAARGNRTEALQQFAAYSALIAEELELEPLEHTLALVEEIRQGRSESPEPEASDPSAAEAPSDGERTGPSEDEDRAGSLAEISRADIPALFATDVRPSVVALSSGLQAARVLGSGSTGTVYLAREIALKRLVAVKLLDPDLADQPLARARFSRETLLAARVAHPNVAQVFTVGTSDDGAPYFVMPYIKGVTLAERIEAQGPLPMAEVRQLLAVIADALAAAHAVNVIHRDVRPANVLFEEDTGRPYLADFGVAGTLESADEDTVRLTRTGELLGNPEYISPEQTRGQPLDDRSDVYSLGVLGWELLLGRPIPKELPDEVAGQDPQLVGLLNRATAEKPKHRPSAAQLAAILSAPPSNIVPETGVWTEIWKRRILPIVGAYLAAGIAGMGGVDQLVQQEILAPIAYRLALAFFVAGFNASVIVAWFHGAPGRQRVPRLEVVLLSLVFVAWVLGSIMILT